MVVKKVSENFWRLELKSGDNRLIWYAPSRVEVRSKFRRWARDKKTEQITPHTPLPTIASEQVAHLE